MENIKEQLKMKLSEMDSLRGIEPYSAKYEIWDKLTTRLLSKVLDADLLEVFTDRPMMMSADPEMNKEGYLEHLLAKEDALINLIDNI